MSSLYTKFEADENLETSGVWVDYGDFRVLLARAGGSNKRYASHLEALTKPVRRALQSGTLTDERSMKILHDAYSTTVILGWQTKDSLTDDWVDGIEMRDGIKPANKDNLMQLFADLPNLFLNLQEAANDMSVFRKIQLEEDAKNS